MNKLDHVVTNAINNKNQCDNAIEYDLKFDNTFSLSSGNKEPLLLLTVSLQGGKKHRETIIYSLICLWDIGSTSSMIGI